MSKKCIYCNKKKGKRSCPDLNGYICSSCCGENRQREIRCPNTCQYLIGNKDYYQKRMEKEYHKSYIETFQAVDTQSGNSGICIFNSIGLSIYYYNHKHGDISDYDLRKGLEALKEEFSVIKTPYQTKSDIGDSLIEMIGYTKDDPDNPDIDSNCIPDVCDKYIALLNKISGESMHSSIFREFLMDMLNKLFPYAEESIKSEMAEKRKIIEPSIILP